SEPAGVTEIADSPATGELIQNFGKNYVNGSATVQTTRYVAPSGAVVFATGTNQWDWGLAVSPAGTGQPDTRIQQVTANALSDMGALAQTPDSSITVDD